MSRMKFEGLLENEFTLSDKVLRSKNGTDSGVIDVPVENLILDEENITIFGDFNQDSIDSLSKDIENDGFKGTILAYPIRKDGDLQFYQIESGHKRYLAAKQAGLKKVPVIVTEIPKSDAERRLRLISMNLHTRETPKPSILANEAAILLNSIRELREEEGVSTDMTTLTQLVAERMERSTKAIEKYRQFKKLIPKLQDLADEGASWSALVNCSSLSPERQEMIAFKIRNEAETVGVENISRQWILNLIAKARNEELGEIDIIPPKVSTRRRDGAKIIAKCAKDFEDILNNNAVIKNSSKEKAIEDLKNIREIIDKKLTELEEE